MNWTSRMIDSLAAAKACGMDFESAWAGAVMINPPGRRQVSEVQLTLYGKRDESMEEFLYRVAEDAWYDRKPLLRHLPGLLDSVSHDASVAAVDGPRRHATLVA